MARLIKAVSKKPKVTKRSSKKASPNKEAASLHQAFINSRTALETYWQKKTAQLKKQLETLTTKHEKVAKQKSAKTSAQKLKQSVDAIAEIREAFKSAKSSASKYAALGKSINQFERDWTKKAAETATKPAKTKAVKQHKTSAIPPKDNAKKLSKQKAQKIQPVEDWAVEIIEEEKEGKVVPIAKKGRNKKKGKEQAAPAMAALPVEEIADEMEDMISEDDEEYDAVAEELASDDLYLELDEEDLVSELRIIDDASSDLLEEEDPYEDYSS